MQHKKKTIYIIGAGAIGKVLAVFLTLQGYDVILLRGHVNYMEETIEPVEVELPNGEMLQSDVPVCTLNHYGALNGIIVLTTKSHANQALAEKLIPKTGDSPVVIMQNGLDVEFPFIHNSFPDIYRCVLFTSCQFIDNNRLRFKPATVSPIGVVRGNNESLYTIIECLQNPYLIFKAEENIQPIIWTKVIINSVFNSICPLLETDNGIFYRNEKALSLARTIIDECLAVAEGEGIILRADKVLERLLLISKTSDGQLISTYQDILHHRKTEIETLNTAIARTAQKSAKTDLIQRTKLLGDLIQIKSELSMSGGIGAGLR
ncbi:MAG: 2-dehydropantoate 2-reductase [Agriterribacter sp.]